MVMRDWMRRNSWSWMLIGIPLGALFGALLIFAWGAEFSGALGVLVGLVLGAWIWVKAVLR